jgi:hypothetical protein
VIEGIVWVLVVAALVVILVVSLFVKRHGEAPTAHPEWSSTDERFRDPSTGRLMRVWLDASGARHYVPD